MRVLIPVDGSISCRNALDLLAARARRMQVKPEVTLINVQHPVPMGVMTQFGLDAVRAAAEKEAKGIFADLEGSLAVTELDPAEKIGFGIPGEVISKEADDEACDLIIMGARGISPAKSFFLGSVSRNVLANTMKPVLLARGESLPDRENLRLVLAVDGSKYGAAAAQFISENPGFFGPAPKVTVVSVMRDYSDLTRAGVTDYEPILRDTRERCEAENTRLWEEATEPVLDILRKADIEAEAVRLTGSPAEEITKYAKDHADMIVMGSHGWGRFKSAVLGSTATKIGALTHLPVLLIRIED